MRPHLLVNNKAAGFTLIELVVVLAVIAILSSMIIGEMGGGYQDALLRASSRKLIGVFSLASSRAISVNRLYRVRFDRAGGRYFVEQHARGDEFVPARGVPDGEGAIDSRIALRIQEAEETEPESPPSIPATPEQPLNEAVNFYPDGTADKRDIELRDRDGFGLALRVNPITARVQIIELKRQ
jgi:type II secretion system protein H